MCSGCIRRVGGGGPIRAGLPGGGAGCLRLRWFSRRFRDLQNAGGGPLARRGWVSRPRGCDSDGRLRQ